MTMKPFHLNSEIPETSLVLKDGTIWSHAATLGTRIKGTQFIIDRSTVENFMRVFQSGYPQKIVVDYEHGTTNGATDRGHPVPAAGQVYELAGVFSADDFKGDLLASVEKLIEKVMPARTLDDPRNYGLWIRWRPTHRALQMITDREYTELSITFVNDLEHNVTGEPQGPAILAVALTNLPFLDDMLPIAASRGDGGDPAAPGTKGAPIMDNPTMLQRAAAFFGKPFASSEAVQDAAEERITSLTTEVTALKGHKSYAEAVIGEVGESDPAKAVTKIRELKTVAEASRQAAESAANTAIEASRDAVLTKHENRLTPAMKEYFGPQIVTELKAGKKAGETAVEKVIGELPVLSLSRKSGADNGTNADTDRDTRINERAEALMAEKPELVEMSKKDKGGAFKKAIRMAARELK